MAGLTKFDLITFASGINYLRDIDSCRRLNGVSGLTEAEIMNLLVDYPGRTIESLNSNGVLPIERFEHDLRLPIQVEIDNASGYQPPSIYSPLEVFNYIKKL
jgi:hypothetical protein